MADFSNEILDLSNRTGAEPIECQIELKFAQNNINIARINILKSMGSRRGGRELFSEICRLRDEQSKLAINLLEAYQTGIRQSMLIGG